ncbi:MAG: hypothetical protein JOY88_13170 [Pelomonas sp.]|nr:hypothetical protein [Roseateles sp.]
MVSLHSRSGYENVNPGLYLHWRSGWVAGAYRNSYRSTSAYGGWLWEIDDRKRFSLLLGLVNGYGRRVLSVEDSAPVPLPDGSGYQFERTVTYSNDRPVVPLIVPSVRFSLGETTSLRLSYFPDPRRGSTQALHLSLDIRL